MKFLYKIHSGYDGFTPQKIPERVHGHTLRLGWKLYIDVIEEGDEIWVYFHGQHKFKNGVYLKGIAEDIDYDRHVVLLRVSKFETSQPISSDADSLRIAAVVAPRYRQVFLLPEELEAAPTCTVATSADTCKARLCGACSKWKALPTVNRRILKTPHRLDGKIDRFAPAFWVIPSRSFLYQESRPIRPGVRRTSELFMRFKTGDENLAYPLALGMQRALAKAHRLDFDAVVPVPLSPEKAKNGEFNRTRALAKELALLLGAPVREWLTLSHSVSKRKLRTGLGFTASEFENNYATKLLADPRFSTVGSVLLVDDVCTEGSTLRVCAAAIRHVHPTAAIIAATAGQMTVKRVVKDASTLCA
jgi:hypothetical protein